MVAAILLITATTLIVVALLVVWSMVRIGQLEKQADAVDERHARLDADVYVETLRAIKEDSNGNRDRTRTRRIRRGH